MSRKPRIFICFNSADRAVADRLGRDLAVAGAEILRGECGAETEAEATSRIAASEAVILVLSRPALKTHALRAEVRCARRRQQAGERPYRLIAAAMEEGLRLPRGLRIEAVSSLVDYPSGLRRLTAMLDLREEGEVLARVAQGGGADAGLVAAHSATVDKTQQAALSLVTPTPIGEVDVHDQPIAWRGLAGKLATVGGIGAAAAVLGGVLSSLMVSGGMAAFEAPTGPVATAAGNWGWFGWLAAGALLLLIARIAWVMAADEIPLDSADYAAVCLKSLGIALVLPAVGSVIFSTAAPGALLQLLMPLGALAATAAILCYLCRDEF